jgi:outer membrane receptor protein involved in Fe transport
MSSGAWWVVACGAVALSPARGRAEVATPMQPGDRAPVFYAAPATAGARAVQLDTAAVAVLRQRIALDLRGVTIPDALAAIGARSGLRFVYDRAVLPPSARVTVAGAEGTVAAALTRVLAGVNVDVELERDGLASIVARHAAPQTGSIIGRVTDAKTGAPLPRASLFLEGRARGATTSDSGTYRISDVAAGSYTLVVRFLGYVEVRRPVMVTAGQLAVADIALTQSVNELDQVVVAGTVVPTEVKAIPTPVSVITADDIDLQRPQTVVQLFRQVVPSAVAWDLGTDPEQTAMSVRGGSTLDIGSGSLKVYLDGIEITNRSLAAIDPQSIDRIEVIRGPQAATIYGSDAIGGVLLVTMKNGIAGLSRPQIDLQLAAGVVQGPYAHQGGGDAARQEYSGSLTGGTPAASYNLGGGYASTGNWVAQGATAVPSAFGSLHVAQGRFTIDVSGRDYTQHTGQAIPPDFALTGVPTFAKPLNDVVTTQEQTVGTSIGFAPFAWWRHSLSVGIDRTLSGLHSSAPRLTTAADTFSTIEQQNESKTTVAYNTSVTLTLSRVVSAVVTAGADHYELDNDSYFTSGATNTTGTIQTDPAQPFVVSQTPVTNTGVFAQSQLGLADRLFLTVGVRAERNSTFGPALGTPVFPRYGIAYAPSIGAVTLKMRASYGEAIRPPGPGDEDAVLTPSVLQLANARLSPERQSGWDTGIDVAFGGQGSIGITYYDQVARELIDAVTLNADTVPQVQQFQNLGRIRNRGLELEGTVRLAIGQLSGQYAITSSRVEALDATYGGDLEVGDQLLVVPRHTGGLSLAIVPLRRTTITVGLSFVGAWTNYDVLAELRCFGGTGPCPSTNRGFIRSYPAFTKVSLAVTRQITPMLSAFVSVKNLTNNEDTEFFNSVPIQGRTTVAGLRLHY